MNNVPELGRFVYEGALWKMPISHWNINQTTEVQEGMEPTSAVHNSWSDLWTDLKTRTSQYQLSKFFESDIKV
jgi:hypothetical protein